MFRKNRHSAQPLLLSDVNGLPERSRRWLEQSWAATFRAEVYARIDESRFAVLYSSTGSRPNVPVNLLVALDILKAQFDWTDEETYEHFLFDLQVRYAVGCDRFGEGDFDLRTLYYFRRRVAEHALTTGENLLQAIFEQITDAQTAQLGLKTDQVRYDSTQLLSNIADQSRLELLIQVVQRLHRMLSAADKTQYAAVFAPYVAESSGQYSYRLKGREVVHEHIQQVGVTLQRLLRDLQADYAAEPAYAVAQRFFDENFVEEAATLRAKANSEIGPGCLQSLDDLEATYRQKGSRTYKGYVANLSETCNPANPVQLINGAQVAPNQVTDIALLADSIAELKARTGVAQVVTDGGYASPVVDQVLREHDVRQVLTGLTGSLPDHQESRLAFSDFELQHGKDGALLSAVCPAGTAADIQPAPSGKSDTLTFPAAACAGCVFFAQKQCPVALKKHGYQLYVPRERGQSAQRRRAFERHKAAARRLRTAVEATVFQLKHKWVKGKLRVRGLFRVTCVVIAAALAVNARRIHRYYHGELRPRAQQAPAVAG
jgi:hypothetical protein